jgi:hypothetical protein
MSQLYELRSGDFVPLTLLIRLLLVLSRSQVMIIIEGRSLLEVLVWPLPIVTGQERLCKSWATVSFKNIFLSEIFVFIVYFYIYHI